MDCFLFKGLSESETEKLIEGFDSPERIEKGGELYRRGFIGIMVSGNGIIRRMSETASTTVRALSSGEIFGAASVFGEWKEGKSSITAVSDCKVIYVGEEQLRCVFEQYPQTSFNYIAYLSDRIRFLNRQLDTFTASGTEHRLYEFLLSRADQNKTVTLGISMAELARRLKIGRTSLYRSLEALEESGLIVRHNHSFIIK